MYLLELEWALLEEYKDEAASCAWILRMVDNVPGETFQAMSAPQEISFIHGAIDDLLDNVILWRSEDVEDVSAIINATSCLPSAEKMDVQQTKEANRVFLTSNTNR